MLHDLVVVLAKDEVLLIVGELMGGHAVEGHAEFVLYQTTEVRNQSEDADTASDGGWLGEDIVGR